MLTIPSNYAKIPRPYYIYEGKTILEQHTRLAEAFLDFGLLYSIKVNPHPAVVRMLASCGCGADAASAKEVDLALSSGIFPHNIFYSTPGKTREDIKGTLGRCRFIADSFQELSLLNAEAAEQDISVKAGLRINPTFSMDGSSGLPSKFGIDEEILPAFIDFLTSLSHVSIEGIHIHLRSQILDLEQIKMYHANVLKSAIHIQDLLGVRLSYINLGSGLGAPYDKEIPLSLPLEDLTAFYQDLREEYKEKLDARLLLESGRFLTASSGHYVTEIVDIKHSRGKTYYVVKNGINGFFRPVLEHMLELQEGRSYEPFFSIPNAHPPTIHNDNADMETVDIVGHLCTPMDILAKDILVPKAKIGDLVSFANAGSYGYTLSPLLFSGQPSPVELFIEPPQA